MAEVIGNEQTEADRSSERRIGEMFDVAYFEDLYNLAVETCLQRPLDPGLSGRDSIGPNNITYHLGVRGISTALNCIATPLYYSDGEKESSDPGKFYLSSTSPVRYPRAFGDRIQPRVQEKIRAFGEGLLAEAYLTLGTDVHGQIEAYKAADTDEEQIQILEWLHCRMKAMTKRDHNQEVLLQQQRQKELGDAYDPNVDYFYHPIRLSPKAIGQFPHQNIGPTCLGISVITSSFAEQVGARHLHAGVMMTHDESLRDMFSESLTVNAYRALDAGNGKLVAELYKAHLKALKERPNRGTHAVTLIQLKSGRWYILDPNYNRSYAFEEPESSRIEQAAATIDEYASIVPDGIELDVDLVHRSSSATLFNLLNNLATTVDLHDGELRDLLTGDEQESLAARAYDIFCSSGFHAVRKKATKKIRKLLLPQDSALGPQTYDEVVFFDNFDKYWQRYVLWGMTNEEIMERCRRDEAFLQRRIEDIKQLPSIALSGAMSMYANDHSYFTHTLGQHVRTHDALEVGAPAYRIGCAVLSDFSSYCDTKLSPSFWLTYWPSKIPVTETSSYRAEGFQRSRIETAMGWLGLMRVAYYSQHGIIKRFEEQRPAE